LGTFEMSAFGVLIHSILMRLAMAILYAEYLAHEIIILISYMNAEYCCARGFSHELDGWNQRNKKRQDGFPRCHSIVRETAKRETAKIGFSESAPRQNDAN
jgi:hypothetical protein